jgi:phenylpropionate dioxygenase-like ring-hydroxylating dioxygenase large terminal subunit
MHRRAFLDPAVFDLEMERVFGRLWIYVGHESQILHPGDFLTATIGRQPVVLCRHVDGSVHVLFNRCGHRGAMVVAEESGNAKQFRCAYHGWTFQTDGTVAGIPLANGYGTGALLDDPTLGMVSVPRSASYQGFVFASLAARGPSLDAFLGGIKTSIDEIVDRAPDGAVEIRGGCHRYVINANWKFQIENLCDMYHPAFSHESTLRKDGRQFERREGDAGAPIRGNDGRSLAFWDETGMSAYAQGHSVQGPMPRAGEPDTEVYRRYRAALAARHGAANVDKVLTLTRHNTMIYPSLAIQSLNLHVRTITPLAVDKTEVRVYPLHLKGAPEEMSRELIRFLNLTHAAGSFIQTDDVEMFERQQSGLRTQGNDWVLYARGLGQERPDNLGGYRGTGTNELGMRAQHQAWLACMSEA